MNKELINSLPADNQPVAFKLNSLVDDLQLSPSFQKELEMKLTDAAQQKTRSRQGWSAQIFPALAWTLVAIAAMLVLNWTVRSLAIPAPASVTTPEPVPSFGESVRQGMICAGPLTLGHGFAVFQTNEDKTGFMPFDEANTIPEMRSFAWSTDGGQLAIIANIQGQGNVFLTDLSNPLKPVLSNSELSYLMGGNWSRDGKQIVLWSLQNNKVIYILNADGSDMVQKHLDQQILGTPQFAPDGKSIVFYGADTDAAGLFELKPDGSQAILINRSVEEETGYAFSPDGSRLAYIEYDRDIGEARLFTLDLSTGDSVIVGKWPIPKNSGASLPESANLSWSADGKYLVFDTGRGAYDRVVYLAPTDGTGLIKLVDPGYAPAISSEGKCLAYINDGKVYLLDLANVPSTTNQPMFLADLPVGRGTPNYKLDKLQWKP